MSQAQTQSLDALVRALQRLPGVGVKSASRMAFHLLQHDRDAALQLAHALQQAVQGVRHCALCNTFTEDEVCPTCLDPRRDAGQLCVVETPADQAALERTGPSRGLFFVRVGKPTPLAGAGAHDIALRRLFERVAQEPPHEVRELILATNFTAEGEATAHVITQLLKTLQVKVTRLARGVPIGSELEYVDLGTIAHALADRR